MSTPRKNIEDVIKVEHGEGIQKSDENPPGLAVEDFGETRMLWSRIDEQSSLICALKDRADEMLLRYQALQKINLDLEDQAAHCQEELDREKEKAETLEERFADLAANNQAIISFMEEHKEQNAQLKLENKRLQLENDSQFSPKLKEKEESVQKLIQEVKLLKEKLTLKDNEYRKKLAECESKLREQAAQHQAKEEQLLSLLLVAQQQHIKAVETFKDFKLKLKETKDQRALKEISMTESLANLTKEKDKMLIISMEKEKVIQEQQEEIQQLETKWKEEKKARIKAQNRFALEADAVNADIRVKSLQAALDESITTIQELNKDFDAFKDHSASLLTQERDLNKKLRHMIG